MKKMEGGQWRGRRRATETQLWGGRGARGSKKKNHGKIKKKKTPIFYLLL